MSTFNRGSAKPAIARNTPFIHLSFGLCLAAFWRLMHTPALFLLIQTLVILMGYCLHCWADGRVLSNGEFRVWRATFIFIHFTSALTAFNDPDLVLFCITDKILGFTVCFLNLVLLDCKVTLSLYTFEAVLLMYRLWDLIGFKDLTPIMVFASVASHILCAATIALVDITVRSTNVAKAVSD